MRRPRIGITTSLNATASGAREQRLDLAYVRAVERAGGLPLVVPMVAHDDAAHEVAALLEGLVVTGGPAVRLGLVGTLPDDIDDTDPDRVESDIRILSAFLDARRPTLGICYGMQLANALRGGTLYADVERQRGVQTHSRGRGATTHSISTVANTRFAGLAGSAPLVVNTRHVQAIDTVGDGLKVSALAPDGVIEAIESDDGSFLGVQFHPEAMEPALDALFRDLVSRAQQTIP